MIIVVGIVLQEEILLPTLHMKLRNIYIFILDKWEFVFLQPNRVCDKENVYIVSIILTT